MSDIAISVSLTGSPDLPSATLQALYRITGRSTVELRAAIAGGDALYTASLFGPAHITVVPRLEKTIAYLTETGLPFMLTEAYDGEESVIDLDGFRQIIEAPEASGA